MIRFVDDEWRQNLQVALPLGRASDTFAFDAGSILLLNHFIPFGGMRRFLYEPI